MDSAGGEVYSPAGAARGCVKTATTIEPGLMLNRSPLSRWIGVALLASSANLPCSAVQSEKPAQASDPYLWLEQVDSPRAMAWVRAENDKTLAVLEKDPRYEGLYRDALAIAEAKDRIPTPAFLDGAVFNFWQDSDHVRGIWRRTTLQSYRAATPDWKTVLDLDALAKAEKANW